MMLWVIILRLRSKPQIPELGIDQSVDIEQSLLDFFDSIYVSIRFGFKSWCVISLDSKDMSGLKLH